MKIREVKNSILEGLTTFAEMNGFKVNKGGFALFSREQNPLSSIFFTYNSWGFEIDLFPWVSVDFKPITEICNQCDFNLNHSAFINLFVLEHLQKHRWHPDLKWQMQVDKTDRLILTDEMDWAAYCDNRINDLLPCAMNYIMELSVIESIDRLYNSLPIKRFNPNCSGLDTHCIIGIISAKLSQNPLYDKLKDSYTKIVRKEDFTEKMKRSFFRILDCLDAY